MGEPNDRPPAHGELGEEIQRLVTAAQQWAQEWSKGAGPADSGGAATPAPGPQSASSCPVWCPICQFAHVLRGEHPELADRLADASTAIATALRAFVDAAASRMSPAPSEPAPEHPRPTPGVQRIHLDDPTEP